MEDKFTNEDFERAPLTEEIFLEEYKRVFEAEYWEWYEKTEGKVIIKNQDGTETEVDETIDDHKLPF